MSELIETIETNVVLNDRSRWAGLNERIGNPETHLRTEGIKLNENRGLKYVCIHLRYILGGKKMLYPAVILINIVIVTSNYIYCDRRQLLFKPL